MVKECSVKLNNDLVTVIDFDGYDVQLPSIHMEAKTIFVSKENGIYKVVDRDYSDENTKSQPKKSVETKAKKPKKEANEEAKETVIETDKRTESA